jgi:hypothetical protein
MSFSDVCRYQKDTKNVVAKLINDYFVDSSCMSNAKHKKSNLHSTLSFVVN